MENIRFGPAGIPIQCKARNTVEGIRCCAELGLMAMEIQFGMGVRLGEEGAKAAGKEAGSHDVLLSSHAPYFVNMCSKDSGKLAISSRNMLQAATATSLAGGRITVFHPGFYQKASPEEAFEHAKTNLAGLEEMLEQRNIKIMLGAETVGKKTAFGGLMENIRLSQELGMVTPVIDFAHLLARGEFNIGTEDDYRKILALVERELPGYGNHMHCHFSGINYNEKGERNHVPLGEIGVPPFRPLMKVLAENGYHGVVISESPALDIDAQKMKKAYLDFNKQKYK